MLKYFDEHKNIRDAFIVFCCVIGGYGVAIFCETIEFGVLAAIPAASTVIFLYFLLGGVLRSKG